METIELNLRAKDAWLKNEKVRRRLDMARWRRQQYIAFLDKKDFDNWLGYTKWHKRPMEVKDLGGMISVKFLDYKGKK
jgi:hypothetical protein